MLINEISWEYFYFRLRYNDDRMECESKLSRLISTASFDNDAFFFFFFFFFFILLLQRTKSIYVDLYKILKRNNLSLTILF